MTDNNDLLVRREDGVLVLTFNRPEHRNALTPEMQARLGEELAAAELDREVGCVLLTGAGGAFCAGGDVKNMARGHPARPADRSARGAWKRSASRSGAPRCACSRWASLRLPPCPAPRPAPASPWRLPATCASPPRRRS